MYMWSITCETFGPTGDSGTYCFTSSIVEGFEKMARNSGVFSCYWGFAFLQEFLSTTSRIVKQWMGQNGLNNYDSWEWDKFIRLQWTLHVQSAMTTVKKKDLMYLRQLLRGFVVLRIGKLFEPPLEINGYTKQLLCLLCSLNSSYYNSQYKAGWSAIRGVALHWSPLFQLLAF